MNPLEEMKKRREEEKSAQINTAEKEEHNAEEEIRNCIQKLNEYSDVSNKFYKKYGYTQINNIFNAFANSKPDAVPIFDRTYPSPKLIGHHPSLAYLLQNDIFTESAWQIIADYCSIKRKEYLFSRYNPSSWYTILFNNRELANELIEASTKANDYYHILYREHDKKTKRETILSCIIAVLSTALGIWQHIIFIPIVGIIIGMFIIIKRAKYGLIDEEKLGGQCILYGIISIVLGFVFHSFLVGLIGVVIAIIYFFFVGFFIYLIYGE
jgi:hypothetical protein